MDCLRGRQNLLVRHGPSGLPVIRPATAVLVRFSGWISKRGREKSLNRRILQLLFLIAVFAVANGNIAAQSVQPQASNKANPVAFKMPDGYMRAEFPEKRIGMLLLNAKKPGGMFIVYPKAGEGPEVLPNLLKSTVAEMFFHDSKPQAEWTTLPLPAHQGIENESGTLYSAADEKMEIQLAVYTRTLGETTLLYGYYGMRHKGKKSKDDAPFLDSAGKGVKDFDEFWKSIHA